MGIVEDSSNRNRLAKLLRVHTSKSPDKLVSLEKYVSRMKPDQKHIYFVAGAPDPDEHTSCRRHTRVL
jgi:heat shock protein beta